MLSQINYVYFLGLDTDNFSLLLKFIVGYVFSPFFKFQQNLLPQLLSTQSHLRTKHKENNKKHFCSTHEATPF
jgi:hypothetical protein